MLMIAIRNLCRVQHTQPLRLANVIYNAEETIMSPLVVLHGLFGSKSNWKSMSKRFVQNFRPRRSVITVDQRNHGESPHSESHSYKDLAYDLKSMLDSLRVSSTCILGHSMGGRTGMLFSLLYPEYVEKLIVVDISPVTATTSFQSLPLVITAMEAVRLPTNMSLANARSEVDNQLKNTISEAALRSFLLTNIVVDSNGKCQWRCNLSALKDNFDSNISRFPTVDGLTFHKPVLFIKGSESDFLPLEDMPKIFKLFPAASIVTIDGAGHWVHESNPQLFLDTVIKFVNDQV